MFLSRLADSAVLVVRWLNTTQKVAESAVRHLQRAKVAIDGVVLTRVDPRFYEKNDYL